METLEKFKPLQGTAEFMVPVRKAEIEIGKPLAFSAYDADHNLLLNSGIVVTSNTQLQALLARGLYRDRVRPLSPSSAKTQHEKKDVGPKHETVSLDEIKLMPGDALQLQPLMEGQTERYTVKVIGALHHKSLLVSAPMVDGKFIFVHDGQSYLVRAFSGLNVCAFKTRILKSQLQPLPYLHLSYPSSVQAVRIRKAMRTPASVIVAVHETETGRQTGAGKIVDLSVGGARLVAPTLLGEAGQTLWLSFKLRMEDMEEYVKAQAKLKLVDTELDEKGKVLYVYGLQFVELDKPQRLFIMNLVYQHLLKEDRPAA